MRYSKSGEGDFFNHYKTHLLEQFKIQLLCSGPRQFLNMDIDNVKRFTLGLNLILEVIHQDLKGTKFGHQVFNSQDCVII